MQQLQDALGTLSAQSSGPTEDQVQQDQITELQQQVRYLSDQKAEHDRSEAVSEAKVRYLVRLVQNLQTQRESSIEQAISASMS